MAGQYKVIWLAHSPYQSDFDVGSGFNFSDLWADKGHEFRVDDWLAEGMWFWSWRIEPNQKKPINGMGGLYFVIAQIPKVGLSLVPVPAALVPEVVKIKVRKVRRELEAEVAKNEQVMATRGGVALEWAVAGRVRHTKSRRISGN